MMFLDYSVIVVCIGRWQEAEGRSAVNSFVEQYELYQLQLNITKTKEFQVDFRKQRTCSNPVLV